MQLEFPFMIEIKSWDGQRTFTHYLSEKAFQEAAWRAEHYRNIQRLLNQIIDPKAVKDFLDWLKKFPLMPAELVAWDKTLELTVGQGRCNII